jgi:hypothetical protein
VYCTTRSTSTVCTLDMNIVDTTIHIHMKCLGKSVYQYGAYSPLLRIFIYHAELYDISILVIDMNMG